MPVSNNMLPTSLLSARLVNTPANKLTLMIPGKISDPPNAVSPNSRDNCTRRSPAVPATLGTAPAPSHAQNRNLLFAQPPCIIEHILLHPTLTITDRCRISQTCRPLHRLASTLYSVLDFPLSPASITTFAHRRQGACTPDGFRPVPVIVLRSGEYNVAIGWDGEDYSTVFFNRRCIVRVVRVKSNKDGVSIEHLYSTLVQRILFTCSRYKDRVMQIESPLGRDYFAHARTLTDVVEKFAERAIRISHSEEVVSNADLRAELAAWRDSQLTRDVLLKGIVGTVRRFKQRERTICRDQSGGAPATVEEQSWYIMALTQFHYRYLACQQKLYLFGASLKKEHDDIMQFAQGEFRETLLASFSAGRDGDVAATLGRSLSDASTSSLESMAGGSAPGDPADDVPVFTVAELERQLSQLNERHLLLMRLLEKFKSVIIMHQSLRSCGIVFRKFELQFLHERLRGDLMRSLHRLDMVAEVIDRMIPTLQGILNDLYEQDLRDQYAVLSKELAGDGVAIPGSHAQAPSSTASSIASSSFSNLSATLQTPQSSTCNCSSIPAPVSPLPVYANTLSTSPSSYITTFAASGTVQSGSLTVPSSPSTTTALAAMPAPSPPQPATTFSSPSTTTAIPPHHKPQQDMSADSILDALLLTVPFHQTFSRKMFVKLLAERHFDVMCGDYADHTARIDYDEASSPVSPPDNVPSAGAAPPRRFYDIETGEKVPQDYARRFFISWFDSHLMHYLNALCESGDWLNGACYFLESARLLLADGSMWVKRYDGSDGYFGNEWRHGEIVERVEEVLVRVARDVVRPGIEGSVDAGMRRVWLTWWLYACCEVLEGVEQADVRGIMAEMEGVLDVGRWEVGTVDGVV